MRNKFKKGDIVVVIKHPKKDFIGKVGTIINSYVSHHCSYAVDFGEELVGENGFLLTHTCNRRLKNSTGRLIDERHLELFDEDLICSETIIRG